MKRLPYLFSATFALALILSACNKYPEGPVISFKSPSSRVVNKWQVEYGLINGADKTFLYDSTTFEFLEDGSIIFSSVVDGDSAKQEGLWDLVLEESQIRILYTDPAIFPDRAYWEIVRLKEKEMWVKEDQDSIVYEFRLIPR